MNDASDLPLSAPAVVQPSYAGPTGEGPRPTPRLSGGLDQDDAIPADPFALDGELRRLLTTRQRHDESLASFLRLVARDGGFRDEGFPCMEAYAFDRFGLSPRNLYYMLSLGRTLEASSGLRNLFLSGALTARQTILVGRVASARSLDAWVVRAGRVSLRRLEEEVAFFRHLEECRPGVWGLLERQPPPEGLVLVPGEGPRLRASARPEGRANSGSFPPAPDPQADGSHRRSSAHFQGNDSRAERFLRALEADEKATPLPGRMVVIRLWVEPGVKKMLHALRASLSEKVGAPLRDWEALALLMKEFWSVWDNQETRRQRKLQPVLERDAWRCTAPGCTSMGTGRLEDHHVKFRSEGGSDDLSNRTSVCRGHHRLIHEGRVRVTGRAPDELLWEMGVTNGREPFLVYLNERRIGGCAK
jgi:hypothetical protein